MALVTAKAKATTLSLSCEAAGGRRRPRKTLGLYTSESSSPEPKLSPSGNGKVMIALHPPVLPGLDHAKRRQRNGKLSIVI